MVISVPPTTRERGEEDLNGILPIAKSTNWRDWDLPGNGEPYHDCGLFQWKGCLNVGGHRIRTIDGQDYTGKVYVKGYKRSCARAECPVCYEKWASKEAIKSSKRLRAYQARYVRPIHVVISPPSEECALSYPSLRKRVITHLKESGLVGGLVIVHPFRKFDGSWKLSPHFHAVGYGWIKNTAEIFNKSGYVIKNLGTRGSSRATILYQLSHAGVKNSIHTLTWFGALSYNKLKVVITQEKEICPICRGDICRISFIQQGKSPPIPEKEEEFFTDAEGWVEKIIDF